MSATQQQRVVMSSDPGLSYPKAAPFHPDTLYPEYSDLEVSVAPNGVYHAVREMLRLAGLDAANFGTPAWNPLAEYIKPGQFVLLKPNLVKETHPRDPESGWVYTITHGSVIRAVADYVFKALNGTGRVMIADAPQSDSDFEAMVRLSGLDTLRDYYAERGLTLELVDLRKECFVNREEVITSRYELPGDPNGYIAFDLGKDSEFADHGGGGRYYGADYNCRELNKHHTGGKHEYLVAASPILCDVFINLPKLKTHKKSGITVNLKNLVGVNGDKNWLPHHTNGHPGNGGDQYPSYSAKRAIEHAAVQVLRKMALRVPLLGSWMMRRARKAGKQVFGDTDKVVRSGNWFGNNTIWRMCLDLNKIVLFGKADGTFRSGSLENRKTYLSFVDGVVGGEGDGPMNADPIESKVLLFGTDPCSVDAASAVVMGFDPDRIST